MRFNPIPPVPQFGGIGGSEDKEGNYAYNISSGDPYGSLLPDKGLLPLSMPTPAPAMP